MIKKPADTEVPIIEPILLKAPNLELMAEAVAATTMEVIMTMLGGGAVMSEMEERVWKGLIANGKEVRRGVGSLR